MEKTQLKRDNYAYHCQACLGLHQPELGLPQLVWRLPRRNAQNHGRLAGVAVFPSVLVPLWTALHELDDVHAALLCFSSDVMHRLAA